LLGILLWQLAASWIIRSENILPGPWPVAKTLADLAVSGELFVHLWASLRLFVIGLALSVPVGVLIGYAWAHSSFVQDYLQPWLSFFYAMPRIAFAPLLVLWFGLGMVSYVAIVFTGAVFPMIFNTYTGIKSVPEDLLEVGQSFRANRRQIFFQIVVPASLPFLLAGLRLAIARSLIGVAIAEWFGARQGLGHLVYFYGQTFNTRGYFAGIVVFALLGVLLFDMMARLERKLAPWRETLRLRADD